VAHQGDDIGDADMAERLDGAVVEAARELQERGTYTFWEHARPGSRSAKAAFTNAASSNP